MAGIGTQLADLGIKAPNIGGIIPYITYGFIIIIIGMLAWFFLRQKTYPIRVRVLRKTGSGLLDINDDGIIKNIEGTEKLWVHSIKKWAPRPDSSSFIPTRGLFKKWTLHMYLDSNGNLVPISFNNESYEKVLVPRQLDMEQWAQIERKRIDRKYGDDWLSKYGVLVAQGLVSVALLVGIFIAANKYVEGQELFAQAANHLATVIQATRGG